MSTDDRRETRADGHVTTLVSQTAQRIGRLARDEARLARAELADNRRDLGLAGGLIAGAGVLGLVAVLAATAGAIAALARFLPVWLAASAVAAAAALAAAAATLLGKKQVERAAPAMEETVDRVKADVAAIKEAGHGE